FEGETANVPLLREGNPEADGTLTYSAQSSKILAVSDDGTITGLSKGSGKVTAKLKTEKRTYTATLTVNVARRVSEVVVNEEKLTVCQPDDPLIAGLLTVETEDPVLLLLMGSNTVVNATCQPKDASDRKYGIEVTDPEMIQVQGTNKNTLKPLQTGECDLRVYSVQNPEIGVQYHALILMPVNSIDIIAAEKIVPVGGSRQLAYAVQPDDASIQEVTWSSSDTRIATVDENGLVTGVKRGRVNIRATAVDGSGKSRSMQIEVQQTPTEIKLNKTEVSVKVKHNTQLTPTVLPKEVNNKSVTWASSDESIATVSSNGSVRGVKAGTCDIICISKSDPDVQAVARVTVIQPATSVAFTEKSVSLEVLTERYVSWTVGPDDVTDPSVKLTSSNTKVVTVDQDGRLYGVKAGTATVTATTTDGSNVRGTIKVTVIQPVTGVHMSSSKYSTDVDKSVTITAVLEPSDATDKTMTWYSEDESIATVHGTTNRPYVRGHAWGDTTVHGITNDGGYATSVQIHVGDYDTAVRIRELKIKNNKISIELKNVSNMYITKVYFRIACFTQYGEMVECTRYGDVEFNGSYSYELEPGGITAHGRFTFDDFVQPELLCGIQMHIIGYRTDEGITHSIDEEKQPYAEDYTSPFYDVPESDDPVYWDSSDAD
ncbi:MAG: Ig-like domain-containing protein, partial [Clostridia bacterium]|nr:Ig-like domain-containing protein [Clostridia bacterium]